MRKFLSISLVTAMVVTVAFSSCGKYDDGPVFSLASKKSRAVNIWKLDRMYSNGTDITSYFIALWPAYSLDIKDDGSYIQTWANSVAETGTWEFDAAQENILTTPNGTSTATKWRILRLKSGEAWVEVTSGYDVVEYQFVTK